MGVAGQENLVELSSALAQVNSDAAGEGKEKNVVTDEVEEKEAALQMLSVFIEEVPDVCYENGDKISNLLMSLTTYEANNGIRQSSAQCLSSLMQAAKKRGISKE